MQAACSVSREKCRHLHFQSRMGYYPQLSEGKDMRKGVLNITVCERVPISTARVVYLQETPRKYNALYTIPSEKVDKSTFLHKN